MLEYISHVALIVDDYDIAIQYYTQVLKFNLIEDTYLNESKRWVLVRPKGGGCSILLAKAKNEVERMAIGNQSGGRVFLFLATDNFKDSYENLLINNVKIIREPNKEDYGMVAVFQDIYGNLWDLIEYIKNPD
ncbi:MAG: hypothetical protein RLZZ546_3151 [Bacteroidota bacterium]